MIAVECHDGPLEDLEREWEGLFASDPDASPFSSLHWARAWWPHWGDGGRPFVLLAREGPDVVGLAPFVVRRHGPFRVMRVLGSEPADLWEVLALPGRRPQVAQAIARELARRRGEWDVLVLKGQIDGAPLLSALPEARLSVRRREPSAYPYVPLPSSFDDYLKTLPTSRRTNLRRRLRHLDDGTLALHEVVDPAALPAAVARWQRLRAHQWRTTGKELAPLHGSDRFRDFMRDLVTRLVPAGLALFWELRRDEELVGSYINFADERAFYSWLGGFDPKVGDLGIGKVVTGHGIRMSIEAGRRIYDFLEGAEEYKYWYGARDRYAIPLLVSSGTPRSQAALRVGTALNRLG